MIRDAAQVTGMTPRGWMLDPLVAKVAASRHVIIPPLDATAEDAPPLPAFVNWGNWKVMCDEPNCLGQAEDVWRDWPYMLCMKCGNRRYGGRWRPVEMPEDAPAIESSLDELPRHQQHWHPTEPGLGGPPAYEVQEIDDDPAVFMTIEQQNRVRMATGGLIDSEQAYIVGERGDEVWHAGNDTPGSGLDA